MHFAPGRMPAVPETQAAGDRVHRYRSRESPPGEACESSSNRDAGGSRTLQFGQIAMRTGDPSSKLRQQPSLKVRRNRVFQPSASSCTLYHSIPKISASMRSIRCGEPSVCGQSFVRQRLGEHARRMHPHQSIFLQPAHAIVTAGGETFSQCASVAEITASPSLSASRIALR